jgi:hypothetical protein
MKRDKYLTEIIGDCWHGASTEKTSHGLCSCGMDFVSHWNLVDHLSEVGNNDFSTPVGFFKLFNWSRQQSWYLDFKATLGCKGIWDGVSDYYLHDHYIHPDNFANALYGYLGGTYES